MNELVNDGGDYRTAPATPGLLNMYLADRHRARDWCIKSIYNRFAIGIDCTFKSCAFQFRFCSSHASFQKLLLVT